MRAWEKLTIRFPNSSVSSMNRARVSVLRLRRYSAVALRTVSGGLVSYPLAMNSMAPWTVQARHRLDFGSQLVGESFVGVGDGLGPGDETQPAPWRDWCR